MEESQQNTSLKAQSAWLLFAKIVGFVFTLLLPLLIVRFLPQDQVGVYRQIFQVIINANAILPLGVSMSAFYFLSREKERRSAAILNILLFNFIVGGVACLTLFLYPQLVGNIFQNAEITRLAPKIGVVIWLWIFSSFLETVAVANQETRTATAFIILAQFTKTLLMVGAVIFFANVESFVYAAMIQAALQTVVLFVYLNSRFPRFWTKFDFKFFREQLFYAIPFGLAGLLWTLQTDIHNYFVGYRFSASEYAIYAYGCFELPLIAMLSESVTSVLIPRMSKLQAENDKREMLRLSVRTMQKLSFFYFPIYLFLVITAQTFIVTLFTRNYLASVPIFLINLTLMPFYVWVVDPIVRSYKELGRFLLATRIFIFIALISALYFGIQNFDLRGMIAIVVVVTLTEKFISTSALLRKLEVKTSDFYLLKDVAKTAFSSIIAGLVTFLFYWQFSEKLSALSAAFVTNQIGITKLGLIDFISGIFVLAITFLIFAPIYLILTNYFGLIDEEEKSFVKKIFNNFVFIIFKKDEAKTL
ncbi:MAG TPA: oligosaccharide flippase family protein [Pyrinomonadaceae bacterium]|nr:oligosaccharide flippase family protein [Pyrinomonadaceae bacterium]